MSPDSSDTYQTDKALEAISNGGFFGRGPGEGAVKYSLPDGHTDFIFAVTVEEFGFYVPRTSPRRNAESPRLGHRYDDR